MNYIDLFSNYEVYKFRKPRQVLLKLETLFEFLLFVIIVGFEGVYVFDDELQDFGSFLYVSYSLYLFAI